MSSRTTEDVTMLSAEISRIFDHGVGYVPSDKNKLKYDTGRMVNVNYAVENTRVGSSMDYDQLDMKVTTNGSLTPTEAFIVGTQILKEHFGLLLLPA